MLDNSTVRANIARVREEIARAARAAGRPAPLLLAATKTVPAEQINFAVKECGVTAIGENRVQELLEKYPQLEGGAKLHFIGRLQRNKVKYIADKVDMIESVDSVPLAQEIEKQAKKHNRVIDVLLEVNTGREEQKGGFMPEELESALAEIAPLPHLHVCGLMAVSPVTQKSEEKSRYFEETYQKFIDISAKKLHNIDMNVLSMGMTDSYSEAIAAGSTEVRLGSALFGRRDITPKEEK
ncbi:MAG: YggS family pyridoxal phosphate-dependent enzyme [Clostridia bacterium]|nr:YggS family pyridoxal phosphate-dependent enzyme [Clostridia bacterium]